MENIDIQKSENYQSNLSKIERFSIDKTFRIKSVANWVEIVYIHWGRGI